MSKYKIIYLIFFITTCENLKVYRDRVLRYDCRRSEILPAVMSYTLSSVVLNHFSI